MNASGDFRSGSDLEAIAMSDLGEGADALSLPLPVMRPEGVRVVFLVYDEPVREDLEIVCPPREWLEVDPRTGDKWSRACDPREFGVNAEPNQVHVGFGLTIPPSTFAPKSRRLLEIAPMVWRAFEAGGKPTQDILDVIHEHDTLVESLTKAPLRPYYAHVGQSYFTWSRSVTG